MKTAIEQKMENLVEAKIKHAHNLYDSIRSKDTPYKIEDCYNSGMIREEHLKPNIQYYGYSGKTTKAIWNTKEKFFVGKIDGIVLKMKYFDDFVPTLSEEELQSIRPMTLTQAQEDYKKQILKFDELDDELTNIQRSRDEQMMKVHQSRMRFEKTLKEE